MLLEHVCSACVRSAELTAVIQVFYLLSIREVYSVIDGDYNAMISKYYYLEER